MTHWGWYWKIKKKHTPKALCSWQQFLEIDSFRMFKVKELVQLVKASKDRISFEIPQHGLVAALQDDNSLNVKFNSGSYVIPVEAMPCNYGGVYYFFHCPCCKMRMRKLYCKEGQYLCRKCAGLGYLSQRLRPSERCATMSYRTKNYLKNRAGSLERKPPWMKQHTFQKIRQKYVEYDEKRFHALNREVSSWYGSEHSMLGYDYFPSIDMMDVYVEREETNQNFK